MRSARPVSLFSSLSTVPYERILLTINSAQAPDNVRAETASDRQGQTELHLRGGCIPIPCPCGDGECWLGVCAVM
jgi:hypothetical protein